MLTIVAYAFRQAPLPLYCFRPLIGSVLGHALHLLEPTPKSEHKTRSWPTEPVSWEAYPLSTLSQGKETIVRAA